MIFFKLFKFLFFKITTNWKKSVINMFSMTASPKIGITLTQGRYIRLSFRNRGRDQFYNTLMQSVKTKKWLQNKTASSSNLLASNRPGPPAQMKTAASADPIQLPAPQTEFSTLNAGVSGIIRKQQEKNQTNNENLQEAFKDIDNLMSNAKQMVEFSKSLSLKLNEKDQNQEENSAQKELREFMINMGISNPVTKFVFPPPSPPPPPSSIKHHSN